VFTVVSRSAVRLMALRHLRPSAADRGAPAPGAQGHPFDFLKSGNHRERERARYFWVKDVMLATDVLVGIETRPGRLSRGRFT
jgi:hypothetical protein